MRKSLATLALTAAFLTVPATIASAETTAPHPTPAATSTTTTAPADDDDDSDKTGLWGLLGLLGLLGLIPRKKQVTEVRETHRPQPAHHETHRDVHATDGQHRAGTTGTQAERDLRHQDLRDGDLRDDLPRDGRDGRV